MSLLLGLGCRAQKRPSGSETATASLPPVLSPTDATALLKDKNSEEPVCLEGVGSDEKKLIVGRLSPFVAEHETGRLYVSVFNSEIDHLGHRRVSMNRTFFNDPAAALQAATAMGANQFQVCKFGEM
jgi:hypothetical protein